MPLAVYEAQPGVDFALEQSSRWEVRVGLAEPHGIAAEPEEEIPEGRIVDFEGIGSVEAEVIHGDDGEFRVVYR